jgi:hypothetical protein
MCHKLRQRGQRNPQPDIKTGEVSESFVLLNNTKCPQTETKIIVSVVILRTVLFVLLREVFN